MFKDLRDITNNLFEKKPAFMVQLVLPALVFMTLFQIVPIIHGMYTSLTEYPLWQGYGTFIGFKNYINMLKKPHF